MLKYHKFCKYNKKNEDLFINIINNKQNSLFGNLNKRGGKYIHTCTALKRKDRLRCERKLKLREKFKIIVYTSLYFFTCDYLYHEFILKNNKNENKEEKKNEQNIDPVGLNNKIKKKEYDNNNNNYNNIYKPNDSLKNDQSYFFLYSNPFVNFFVDSIKKLNIFVNSNTIHNENEDKQGDKNLKKVDKKNDEKENNSYEIKITRGSRNKNIYENSIIDKEKLLYKGNYHNNNNNDNNETYKKHNNNNNNMSNIISNHIYNKNYFFNKCNLFLLCNGLIFITWRISEVLTNKRLFHFMCRNFICSYNNIKKKYIHTLITSSVSHITFPHFLFNMWAFYTITNTLLSPEIGESKKKFYFFNYKSNVLQQKMNDQDIINICVLSSICSTIPYILLNKKNQILGASGSIMGLVYILSTLKPNEVFISIFPLPYLKLTALQLCHLSILTNIFFLFFRKKKINHFNIAWSAHIFGLLGGALYNIYQRKIKNNNNYYPFIQLSIKNGYLDYVNSYLDLLDMLKCFHLQTKMFFSLDIKTMQSLNRKIQSIKSHTAQRRMHFQIKKMKNLEFLSKRNQLQ
ncbi:putative rhomboid protease ROM6 [Plasmodium gaboni]|uniref:Putative rhomboid protease ROM6 n=1 Tax=Plasmodium gaboni TaxID=647221 RepID=A0A151LE31_9APIC|nr:putative rhomboid protease ROM6 [Plasmodium gaboni]KYN97222.1 putative rhomboid protease ROM6 [Plasmodium gaboni]